MSLVIPPGYANFIVTIRNTAGGGSAESSIAIGMRPPVPLSQVTMAAVSAEMRNAIRDIYDNGWRVGPVTAYENVAGSILRWDDPTEDAGTASAADYASPAVSLVVTKRTALAGKQHRGRFYLPGVIETKVGEDGVLDATYRGDVQGAMDDLWTNLDALVGWEPPKLFHDEESPGALAPDTITSFLVRTVVGTQRPRQRR